MGERMTLTAVRDALLEEKAWARGIDWPMAAHKLQQWADAIDAHLTQPAQAVDVEKVREVIAELREADSPSPLRFREWADKLTAALPNANGKEG